MFSGLMYTKTGQPNSASASFLEEVNRNFNNSLQQNRQGRRRHAAGDKVEEVGDLAKRNLLDVFLTPEEDCNKPVDVKEILEQRTRGKPGTKYYKAPEIVSRTTVFFWFNVILF